MGSRSRRYASLILLAGCSVGAPTGFSAGESWTAPLIGPLEDSQLLVPVFISGKGPYVFAIDPDAPQSIITERVAKDAKLQVGQDPGKQLDESDTGRTRFFAEVYGLEVGTLTVERIQAMVIAEHTYDFDGRTVDGVLGRNVITDSTAWSFDRDRGVITLMTQKAFEKAGPAFGGTPVKYNEVTAQIANISAQPVPRRLVQTQIDGVPFTLHVDFGASASQLRDRSWDKAKLAATKQSGGVVDEIGTPRAIDKIGKAATVALGTTTDTDVEFVPYGDKRWHDEDFEGSLGLGFFHGQNVLVNWDKDTFWVKPRASLVATTKDRIGRWQSSLMPKCASVGCVTASVVDPLANKPADQRPAQHPGVIVSVARDPAAANVALEVLIAIQAPGVDPQWLVANLPAQGGDRAMTHLPGTYAGATATVVDASPFPRTCATAGGCIDTLRVPPEAKSMPVPAAPAAAPAAPAAPTEPAPPPAS